MVPTGRTTPLGAPSAHLSHKNCRLQNEVTRLEAVEDMQRLGAIFADQLLGLDRSGLGGCGRRKSVLCGLADFGGLFCYVTSKVFTFPKRSRIFSSLSRRAFGAERLSSTCSQIQDELEAFGYKKRTRRLGPITVAHLLLFARSPRVESGGFEPAAGSNTCLQRHGSETPSQLPGHGTQGRTQ